MLRKKIIFFILLLIITSYIISDKCGKEGNKKSRISGGYQSEPNRYPWMVFFSYYSKGGKYMCGGSLISNKLILTAKHCTQKIDFWGTAGVGVHNWRMNLNEYQKVEFKKVILHETENDNDNDIAIILLKEPVDLEDPTIGTVCLPQTEKEEYIGESVKGMGWGMVKRNTYEELLKVVDLKVAKKQEKNWLYTYLPKIEGVYQDPCAGDSGGPLVHKKGNRWTIIGTVFGNGYDCISGEVYGLGRWNKVTDHLKWIKRIMKKYKDNAIETRDPGFHEQGAALIHPYEHGRGNMENNYRDKNVGNDKVKIYKDNFIANKYIGYIYNQGNGNIVQKFRNTNVGNYNNSKNRYNSSNFINEKFTKNNGVPFVGNAPVNRYGSNNKINIFSEYNKGNAYLNNYQASGYRGNIDINRYIRKNHEHSNNKENRYMDSYQLNGYIDNNHINGHIRKNHENSKNKEIAYLDKYKINGYVSNNHIKEYIRKYHENSDNRENAYMDNYHLNGYAGNNDINGNIRKNHENSDKNKNAYVDNYQINGYARNNFDNKNKIDIWKNQYKYIY